MRMRGNEQHVTIKPNSGRLPTLVCSKCGKTYEYNDISDLNGDYPICSDCKKKFKGGPLDGKTVGDLY